MEPLETRILLAPLDNSERGADQPAVTERQNVGVGFEGLGKKSKRTAWLASNPPQETVQQLDNLSIKSNTGDKPQSKVWRYADSWWAVLPSSGGTYLWQLVGTTWQQSLKLSSSTSVKADVKPVGDVVHVLLYKGVASHLVSLEYASPGYQFWSKRPTLSPVALSTGVETATLDLDGAGRMWIVSDSSTSVEARYSDSPYTAWSSPIVLSSNISTDDLAAVTSLPDGSVGVFWSNQNTRRFGFRLHTPGADPSDWSADEVPAAQSALSIGRGMADDHVNLGVGRDGTLYAAVKTSYDTAGYPKIALLVRRPNGVWDPLYEVDQVGTRPIVQVNDALGRVRVVYTLNESGGNIVYRETASQSIAFGSTQVLLNGTWNNVSGTKASVSDQLLVIASSSGVAAGALVTFSGVPAQAPTAYAGPDQLVSSSAILDGSAHEGSPNPFGSLEVIWSKVNGPGTVTFANAAAADTSVTFSVGGTYTLRLTARDGTLSSFDDVIVRATPGFTARSFQDSTSYSGTRDAKISSDQPATNYGSSSLTADGVPDVGSLIKWDVRSISPGSLVQSASISIYVTGTSKDTYSIFQVLRDWSETEVTWTAASASQAWQSPGAQGSADRASTVLGELAAPSTGLLEVPLNADGIAVVQSWIDNPQANYGCIIENYAQASDSVVFSSRETSTVANRPKLTIWTS